MRAGPVAETEVVAEGIGWRLEEDGIVRVTFDRPKERVNLLNRAVLGALGEILDGLGEGRPEARGLLFESTKPGVFLAGADAAETAALNDAFRAAEATRFGQAIVQRIADLTIPTACAISGLCLGEGLELALACTFRLAADDPSVRIGLPQVRLGLVPGFGGTQRLPRVAGLASAADLILTGREIDARSAARLGLIHRVVPREYLVRETTSVLRLAGKDRRAADRLMRRRRAPAIALIESFASLRRAVLLRARRAAVRRGYPADGPAALRALEAIEAAYAVPLRQGLDLEARIVGELVPTPTSRNLVWLFLNRSSLEREGTAVGTPPRRVRRLAVIGSGIMGGGIARLAAARGIPVRLRDVRQEALLAALRAASEHWSEEVRLGRLSRREAGQRLALLSPSLDDRGLGRVDLVIEAVAEDLAAKQSVLAAAEERIAERAVFASNTSSLPIGEIAARALRPERVVGLHFFRPVHRMALVEIVAGQRSSPEAVATVRSFAVRLGKTPVVVRDSPGFLVNRIVMVYLNEAMRLLAEGVRVPAVDAAATGFGMPVGPFALLDQAGLDTVSHVASVLHAAFGRRVGASTTVLSAMVAAGRLGEKNGRGFYHHRGGRRSGPDRKVYVLAQAPRAREIPIETLQERMVLAMVNEAAICLEDGVVQDPRDVDVAMVLGAGFPAARGGLLRYADTVGVTALTDRLSRTADAHGERFRPAALLREMARAERRFYPEG